MVVVALVNRRAVGMEGETFDYDFALVELFGVLPDDLLVVVGGTGEANKQFYGGHNTDDSEDVKKAHQVSRLKDVAYVKGHITKREALEKVLAIIVLLTSSSSCAWPSINIVAEGLRVAASCHVILRRCART